MAGDYKSYLIKASMLLAFGIIWAQYMWCIALQTQQGHTCNESFDTCIHVSDSLHLILSEDHPANASNWSIFDRNYLQNKNKELLDSFQLKRCQSSAEQSIRTTTRQKIPCITTDPCDDDDDVYAYDDCNVEDTVEVLTWIPNRNDIAHFEPLIPIPILVWLLGLFEFFDFILTVQAQEDRNNAYGRHHVMRILPLRLIRWVGILLCFGSLVLCGDHVIPEPFLHVSGPLAPKVATCKQRKCKNRQQPVPDPFSSMFGTTTCVRTPTTALKAFSLNVVGDGNCMWRAIAKPINMKWYTLKRRVIHYIASYEDPEHVQNLRQISRRNAWGNYFALTATASFLQKDIRVFTTQAIIDIHVAGSKGTLDLALSKFHYSLMQNRSAVHLSSACATQFPQTMHSYLQQQSNLPHCIVHRQVYAQKNSSQKNYRYTKSEPSTAKILQKQLAGMVAASKLPAYRPAGQQSGRRRPNEDFEAQIQRIVKAKMAAKGGYVGSAGGGAAPVTPPKHVGPRLVPTPPIGPPPAHLRAPPEPKHPPAKPIIRPAVPRASQLEGEEHMIPKAKPMPRTSAPRPSSAPGILPVGSSRSSSSSTEVPKPRNEPSPVMARPKAAESPSFRLQELLIVSRGTKPECVRVTRKPSELQDPSWDIILKSLHQVDNPERDKTLQGHIGINRRMILQLVQYEPMQTAVLNAAAQALRSQKAAVIFECSQGRHRTVGAAGILYQVLHPLIPKMKLVHASSGNWHSTCQGQCRECKQGPCPQFHLEIDSLRQLLLSQIEREYTEHCVLDLTCNKHVTLHKNPFGQVAELGCQVDQQLLGFLPLPRLSQSSRSPTIIRNSTFGVFKDCPDDGNMISHSCFEEREKCISGGSLQNSQCCKRSLAFSCLWRIFSEGMFHKQLDSEVFPPLDNAPVFGNTLGIFQLKMSNKSQHLQKLAHSKNQVQNKQDEISSAILGCFEQRLQCLQTVMLAQTTSQIKHLNQPRNLCSTTCGGWSDDMASGGGRLLPCCLLHSSTLEVPNIRCSLAFLLVSWILIRGEIVLQISSDCHMCGPDIASPHTQSKCLFQDSAVVGMTTVPTQFTIMKYPRLDMHSTCLHGNICPNCSVEKLQYTKFSTQQKLYATIVSPWWLRQSFRLTDLRDSSRASGGPMSPSSSRSRGLLKPKWLLE